MAWKCKLNWLGRAAGYLSRAAKQSREKGVIEWKGGRTKEGVRFGVDTLDEKKAFGSEDRCPSRRANAPATVLG